MNYKRITLVCLLIIAGLTTGCAKDPSFYEAKTQKRVYDEPQEQDDGSFWGVISHLFISAGSNPN